MLAQDICIISVECNEGEAHSVIEFAVRILNRMFQCRTVSRKEFTKHTSRVTSTYIAKVNDGYDYVLDRKSFAEHANKNTSMKDATKVIKSNYNKTTDLDKDIDPKYFMLESHYIVPTDKETGETLPGRLYMRIILNKCLVIREEAVLLELAKQMSRHRKTEYVLIKRKSGEADDKQGLEMYYQFKDSQTKISKAAQAGLFSWYKEFTGIDIAQIMSQIDKNLDIYLAPQIIKDINIMIKAGEQFIDNMKAMNEQMEIDPDMFEDNEEAKAEMVEIKSRNEYLLANVRPNFDGKVFNTYLCFLVNHKRPEQK